MIHSIIYKGTNTASIDLSYAIVMDGAIDLGSETITLAHHLQWGYKEYGNLPLITA